MPTENRSTDADGWIACDDGLHLIQMDKNLSHYGWVFRKVDGSLPYSVREATPHEMAHAQARQHLRIGVAQIVEQAPVPHPHPEPIAWMVGTAFWWNKEEAERDAAATGLPIVGLGPMTSVVPVQQNKGEPVAWMDPRSPQMHATISNEVKQHNVKFGGAPASAVNGYTIPLYTHADPGEVERLRAELVEWKERGQRNSDEAMSWMDKHDTLRAKLAERDALLAEIAKRHWSGIDFDLPADLVTRIKALSASAEPRAPSKQGSPLEAVRATDIQDLLDRAATAIGQYGDSLLGRGQREDSVDLLDLEREVRDLEQEFRGAFALSGA